MKTYHYTMCGLDYIYLVNGYTKHDTEYGAGVSIKDADGLHKAISRYIICSSHQMTGEEVRFLRGELNISQKSLGELMGLNKQQIMRYEGDRASSIPGTADRLLRIIVAEHMNDDSLIHQIFELLRSIDNEVYSNAEFKTHADGWERSAA